VREALAALADDDAAVMEALTRVLALHARLEERLAELEGSLVRQVHERLAELEGGLARQLDERVAALARALAQPAQAAWPVIATTRETLLEPELDLVAHLAPGLEPRVAIDVGANRGRYSRALLDLGFRVHALEPNPAAREALAAELGARPGLTVHAVAAGAEDGEASLRLVENPDGQYGDPSQYASLSGLALAPGLVVAGSVRVPVRRLDSLAREHAIAPSLVKVDAEGFDLEVLRGMGELRPAVLLAEFWDDAVPMSSPGAKNRLPDLVAQARKLGLAWHLVVFRRWAEDRPAFYGGMSDSPERSWGNVVFFADRARYEDARAFLAGAIAEARFTKSPAVPPEVPPPAPPGQR
jgi:FkbM family methyltransferase